MEICSSCSSVCISFLRSFANGYFCVEPSVTDGINRTFSLGAELLHFPERQVQKGAMHVT